MFAQVALVLIVLQQIICCLKINFDPIESVALSKRIDSVQFLLRGLLNVGYYGKLLTVIRFPVYDFEPLYIEKVCPKLDKKHLLKILSDPSLSSVDKEVLLSPKCLFESDLLSILEPDFAQQLPVNPLLYANYNVDRVNPPLLHELLMKALKERSPVDFSQLLDGNAFQYSRNFFFGHSWRVVSQDSFCASIDRMKEFFIHVSATGFDVYALGTNRGLWAELFQRALSLIAMRQYLNACPSENANSYALASSAIILFPTNQQRIFNDPVLKEIFDALPQLFKINRVSAQTFNRLAVHFIIPVQPEWLLENLSLFDGNEHDIRQLVEGHILPFRRESKQVILQLNSYFRRRFRLQTNTFPVPLDTRTLASKLRQTRQFYLPTNTHTQVLKLHLNHVASVEPIHFVIAAWTELRNYDFPKSNAFLFFGFGIISSAGLTLLPDRRVFFQMILNNFLQVRELYFEDGQNGIIPSPLCPPSLVSILGAILHQNALLLMPARVTLNWEYFSAALRKERSELLELLHDLLEQGLPGIWQNRRILYDSFCAKGFCPSGQAEFENAFVNGAFGLADSLRDVFSEKDYSVDEVYSVLFNK